MGARFKSVKEMVKTALVVLVLFAGSISAKSECSNRCDNGGWCGERRKNTTTGAVQRCADRTGQDRTGQTDTHTCMNACMHACMHACIHARTHARRHARTRT